MGAKKYTPKLLSKKIFKYIYSRVPRACVEVIVKKPDGILLVKRGIRPWKGMWHFPGGSILYHESLARAVQRIARDEVGLKVELKKVLGIIEFFRIYNGELRHDISIACLATVLSGTPRRSQQAIAVQFFKSTPKKTIAKHARFLRAHKLSR